MEQQWNFAEIAAAAGALKTNVAQTENLLMDCNAALGTLQATWEGGASESYQAAQRKWDAASADLNQALADLSSAVDEAGLTMGATEATNLGRFGA